MACNWVVRTLLNGSSAFHADEGPAHSPSTHSSIMRSSLSANMSMVTTIGVYEVSFLPIAHRFQEVAPFPPPPQHRAMAPQSDSLPLEQPKLIKPQAGDFRCLGLSGVPMAELTIVRSQPTALRPKDTIRVCVMRWAGADLDLLDSALRECRLVQLDVPHRGVDASFTLHIDDEEQKPGTEFQTEYDVYDA
ncbi:hypothetical protein VTI74DRAFT_10298 [Chaetomium olivicolor]